MSAQNLSLTSLGVELNKSLVDSSLVNMCRSAISKPIGELSTNELRVLINQKIGLMFLIPVALDKLETDPLTSSGLYRGDLLFGVLKVNKEFWLTNTELNNRLVEIRIEVEEIYDTIRDELLPDFDNFEYL